KVRLQPLKVDEFGARAHLSGSLGVPNLLLLDREVNGCCCTAEIHGLCSWLSVFAPGLQRIFSGRNVFDLKIAFLVGHSKIRRGDNDDVARHFRMDVAEQRSHTEIIELERFLLALRPSAEIMRELFVSA